MSKSGTLSFHSENIFSTIKKHLYSNQEIFVRELVSNAVDATQKLKTLISLGEFNGEAGDTTIEIKIDEEAKTLTFSDKGIGMTEEEIEKYINQIAFSSAGDFLDKYKDTANQIIGHFGLGFYSAFMVAEKVEIITRSHQPDAQSVLWSCDGSMDFSIQPTDKAERGTDIILYIAEEHSEYLQKYHIEEILNKYCKFLPVKILFDGKTINETEPLWTKHPTDLKPEEYENFYQKLYPHTDKPLFWIHINVDYPFNLTGILYFPKLKQNLEIQKNKIQLYSNQVFITDNVEEIVPEYLALMHGVLDSPDIPLNVSRSYLQTDANVRKISAHISKKVANRLNELFKENRENFESKWESLGLFIKYGIIRDSDFYTKTKDIFLFKNIEGKHFTFNEYKEKVAPHQTDKFESIIYLYTNDLDEQDGAIQQAKKRGYDVLVLDSIIDIHFIQYIEHQLEKTGLIRVDSGPLDTLIDKGVAKTSLLNEGEEKELTSIFENLVKNPTTKVVCQALSEDDLPVIIARTEHLRRLEDMQRAGMLGSGEMPIGFQVVINTNHSLAKKIILHPAGESRTTLAQQAYDLALLSQNLLNGSEMTQFIIRSVASLIKN